VVLREQQRMLSELASRYAQDRILDVTCAVELAAFDQPEFHDRVARAQAGVMRAPQMVFGLQGLGRSLAGAIGAGAALLVVEPVMPGCCRNRRCSSTTSSRSPNRRHAWKRVSKGRPSRIRVRSVQ
jgi:hypothetical protein